MKKLGIGLGIGVGVHLLVGLSVIVGFWLRSRKERRRIQRDIQRPKDIHLDILEI